MVSGAISLSSSEFFSPFPHGTGSLSVSREYLALPDGPGGFAQDSSCPALLRIPLAGMNFAKGAVTRYGPTFQTVTLAHARTTARSYNPGCASTHPVWALPRSLATTGGIIDLFSLPAGTKMFQFPAFAS